jgi:hypothetical protein
MNKRNIIHLAIIFISFAMFSCTTAQSQSKKNGKDKEEKYQEDLSKARPVYKQVDTTQVTGKAVQPVAPSQDVTKKLNAKLDTISRNNESIKYGQGFRILVYSGKSSAEVKNVRTKIYEILPEADIYQDFKSPNQRVKVGNCLNRLEAYILHGKLKKEFPNSVILPDQIIIKGK